MMNYWHDGSWWWLMLLIVLACPLMMIFMMRGMMHGMHGGNDKATPEQTTPASVDTTAQDARIAALEREVARLRAERPRDDDPDPAFVDELHGQLDKQLVGPRP
jgi:hypothetical protein